MHLRTTPDGDQFLERFGSITGCPAGRDCSRVQCHNLLTELPHDEPRHAPATAAELDVPYGYQTVPELDRHGRSIGSRIEIHAGEAQIVPVSTELLGQPLPSVVRPRRYRCSMGQWSRVLVEKLGPGFEPPYDSPIEETFAWNAIKYVRPDTSLHKQYDISTKRGGFRLDFVLERNGRRVAFECDGKEFHDAYRDEWRDAITLGEGHVEVVYRLRGHDIHFHISEILYVVAHWESDLFTEAGRLNLSSLNYSPAL